MTVLGESNGDTYMRVEIGPVWLSLGEVRQIDIQLCSVIFLTNCSRGVHNCLATKCGLLILLRNFLPPKKGPRRIVTESKRIGPGAPQVGSHGSFSTMNCVTLSIYKEYLIATLRELSPQCTSTSE